MKSRLIHRLLTAACAIAPLALVPAGPAAAQTISRPANDIVISIGRGQLVTVPGVMADVFVADEKVADVQVKSQRQLYVFGKGGGETTVYASNARGEVIWSANVRVGSNIDSVDQMLRVAMPDARITVSTMGTNTFLLTGTIGAPEDAAEAQRLVNAFVGKEANVISRLKMATPLQVNLQVRIAEVSRTLVKSLSSNLTTMDATNGFQFGLGQGRSFGSQWNAGRVLGVGNTPSQLGIDPTTITAANPAGTLANLPGTDISLVGNTTTLAGTGRLFGLNLLGTLDAGETAGLVTTLAQPNLTAISGETADFLAGGEFPIPTSQGLGTTSIEYKKYGVSLSYTPTVLANGRISMRVRPEVSELGETIRQNGFDVPTINTRRAETTVELGSGQSFMIAGLLKNNTSNTVQKLPGAGDVPVLGALFRSTGFKRGETELVIVVTPYLVNPVDANDIKLPTDGYQAPNDAQRIFGNMESDGRSGKGRPMPTQAPTTQPQTTQQGRSPEGAPAPRIGDAGTAADSAANQLAAASNPLASGRPARASRPSRAAAASAAQPGFSLK